MIRGTNKWGYRVTFRNGGSVEGVIEHDGDFPTAESGIELGYPMTHPFAKGMREGDTIELVMVGGQDHEPWKEQIVRKMVCAGPVSEPVKVKWRGDG